jgi:hypothetical protein
MRGVPGCPRWTLIGSTECQKWLSRGAAKVEHSGAAGRSRHALGSKEPALFRRRDGSILQCSFIDPVVRACRSIPCWSMSPMRTVGRLPR